MVAGTLAGAGTANATCLSVWGIGIGIGIGNGGGCTSEIGGIALGLGASATANTDLGGFALAIGDNATADSVPFPLLPAWLGSPAGFALAIGDTARSQALPVSLALGTGSGGLASAEPFAIALAGGSGPSGTTQAGAVPGALAVAIGDGITPVSPGIGPVIAQTVPLIPGTLLPAPQVAVALGQESQARSRAFSLAGAGPFSSAESSPLSAALVLGRNGTAVADGIFSLALNVTDSIKQGPFPGAGSSATVSPSEDPDGGPALFGRQDGDLQHRRVGAAVGHV